ncbi:MAG: hypothetical protein J7559_12135 [Cohnella sp.]|nr:hypothetical protein [Cohnella sp.]
MDKALKNNSRVSGTSALANQETVIGDQRKRVKDTTPVTRSDIESAVALIEQSFAMQEERIQIIVDAALLALEQVQDKRIELQEKGKNFTIYDIIFDVLSVYLWEVGLIGHVLEPLVKEVTGAIIQRSLKYSAVYNRLNKSDYGAQFIGYARQEENSKKLLNQIIGEHAQNSKMFNSEDFALFSQEVRTMVAKAPDVVWTKAKGEVKKWNDLKKKVKETKLEMTDTPGVSMLKAAQTYVSSQRVALKLQQAKIVAFLRSQTQMTIKELKDYMSIFNAEELPESSFIRDQYQWTFEMLLWAHIYGFTSDWDKSPTAWSTDPRPFGTFFKGIDNRVTFYWFERFRSILSAYVKKDWDSLDLVSKTYYTKKYFVEMMSGIQKRAKETGPIEAAFVVTRVEEQE